ncbi:MAG: amidohydrolase family protein [Stellaceae bacterium]
MGTQVQPLRGILFAPGNHPRRVEANAWRPYTEDCIESFGADCCMFESNFPVDKGACGYPALFNAFKRLANGASASEKADLFATVASRFYRLGKAYVG